MLLYPMQEQHFHDLDKLVGWMHTVDKQKLAIKNQNVLGEIKQPAILLKLNTVIIDK